LLSSRWRVLQERNNRLQTKKKGADVPPAMAEREHPVSSEYRIVVRITSVLPLARHGTLRRPPLPNKKGTGVFSARHDYRQPKVEEGADAFWQVRIKIGVSGIARRLPAADCYGPLGLVVLVVRTKVGNQS
jgi:hypothetical protein